MAVTLIPSYIIWRILSHIYLKTSPHLTHRDYPTRLKLAGSCSITIWGIL